jgi:hypothetical protein
MLATSIQQWARRYLRITQRPRYSPHDGSRIRAFFAHGVEELRFSWVVEIIPMLIHVSLFLFFAGLLIYLFNVSHTVFHAVIWCVAVSTATYMLITFMPILRPDSPYYTPLSSLAFRIHAGILCPTFLVLSCFVSFSREASKRFLALSKDYFNRFIQGMEKRIEIVVQKSSTKMDGFVLKWTFNAISEVNELDQFFEHIEGFFNSPNQNVIKDPRRSLTELGSLKFSWAMEACLNRTWSSNSVVPETDKIQRFITCVNVADATNHDRDFRSVFKTFSQNNNVLRSVEVGCSLRRRDGRSRMKPGVYAQIIVADIITNVQQRDDHWIALAADQLGKSEDDIRRYVTNGYDSVLLANLIHITRQILSHSGVGEEASFVLKWNILPALSQFDIGSTLPELQHDFCALWNQLVAKALRARSQSVPSILIPIRHLYVSLHGPPDFPATDPSTYPLCNNPAHL